MQNDVTIAIYLRDCTEFINKLIQKSLVQEKKDRIIQMENLTSTVSHEMRTPLSAVASFINLLMEMNIGPDDRRKATRVMNLIKY